MSVVLVTGCAGFIGSVTTEKLVNAGHTVIGVDNFQSSFKEAVNKNILFFEGDIGNTVGMTHLLKEYSVEYVFHFAAESIIGISMSNPYKFFEDNIVKGLNLLEAMRHAGVKNLVQSSTASTYGNPLYIPMDENHPQIPVNSYGESKLIFEKMIFWYAKAYGMNYTMFRYYNVGGATEMNGERRKDETRLVPTVLRCMKENTTLNIYGSEYPTKDGTALRDYVHVSDVANAHLLAIDFMKKRPNEIFNLGSGEGFTVKEIVETLEKVVGKKVEWQFADPRPGDPPELVASNHKAIKELGWTPVDSTLERVCRDSQYWFEKMNGKIV